MKSNQHNLKFGYLCDNHIQPVLSNFTRIISYIVPPTMEAQELKKFDYFVDLDGAVEAKPKDKCIPIQDVFANQFKITLDEQVIDAVHAHCNALTCHRENTICIQPETVDIRNIPLNKWIDIINGIHEEHNKHNIFLYMNPNHLIECKYITSQVDHPEWIYSNVITNERQSDPLSFTDIFGIVASSKLVVGPDSSLLHIAGVCDTPLLGLFGPFSPRERISYYNRSYSINLISDSDQGINPICGLDGCQRHEPFAFCPYTNKECLKLLNMDVKEITETIKHVMNTYWENE